MYPVIVSRDKDTVTSVMDVQKTIGDTKCLFVSPVILPRDKDTVTSVMDVQKTIGDTKC